MGKWRQICLNNNKKVHKKDWYKKQSSTLNLPDMWVYDSVVMADTGEAV